MSEKHQYIVSARKYRPATFKTVVGQRALTATLKNAIQSGRLAQAYLFCGPRGVGKTSCARIFAKTINCLNPTPDGEACGKCESCRAIDHGNSFNLVELDAASNNSVDDIRNITDQVNIPPQNGRYRIFIIDEVHMLSNSAFNAFLKTLEEPPKNVVFILATTERHKVIPTILSRCQIYDFRRITVNDIIDHLEYVANQEGVNADREALGVIALLADGAMRDALSIFDQVSASTGGNVNYSSTLEALNVLDQQYYFRMIDIFRKGDVAEALLTFKEIIDKGFDGQTFVNGLASHIRNLMICADPRTLPILETSEDLARMYVQQAPSLPVEWYYNAIKILNDCDFNYRTSGNKRLSVELALIRLSRLLLRDQQIPATLNQNPPQVSSKPEVTGQQSQKMSSPDSQGVQLAKNPPQNSGAPFAQPAETPQVRSVTGNKPAVKKDSKRPSSFRISISDDISLSSINEEKKKEDFSDSSFSETWKKYIETHPEQRILVSAMRTSIPRRVRDEEFTVSVDHPAQKQAFESSMQEIESFLRNELSNDFIKITVEINKEAVGERYLAPKDFLRQTLEENHNLANFLKELDIELE